MPSRVRSAVVLAVTATAASIGLGETAASAASAVTPAANCRTIPVEADLPLQSDIARAAYGVDGSGVKIGIISNSFDQNPTNSTAAQNVSDGLLPGAGNPCGYSQPVVVVHDDDDPDGTDEGRAMAQLVHGIAPGAQIFFASAGGGQSDFIDAIDELAAAGVDVIVDDIVIPDEPLFQESRAAEKVNAVVASGVAYLSSAGNYTTVAKQPSAGVPLSPANGWRTSAYRPTGCPAEVIDHYAQHEPTVTVDCMDFDPGDGVDSVSTFSVDTGQLERFIPEAPSELRGLTALMQWGEPFGGSTARFELYLRTNEGDGPIEGAKPNEPRRSGRVPFMASDSSVELGVSIVRVTDATSPPAITPPIGFHFDEDGPQWIDAAEYWQSAGTDTVGRTIGGHNAARSAITVAARPFDGGVIENFSSLGPVEYYLEPQSRGAAADVLSTPETLRAPTLTSVDGVINTVLGEPDPDRPGAFEFFGTSAAAPNAAAVAALALQLDPSLDPVELRTLLTDTALPLAQPYPTVSGEDSVGAGLINAPNLLARVAAQLPPAPAPVPAPAPGDGTAPAAVVARPMLADSGAAGLPGSVLATVVLLAAGTAMVLGRRMLLRRRPRKLAVGASRSRQ